MIPAILIIIIIIIMITITITIIITIIIITTRMVVIDAFRYSGRAVGVQLAAHIRTQVLSFQSLQQPIIANSRCF